MGVRLSLRTGVFIYNKSTIYLSLTFLHPLFRTIYRIVYISLYEPQTQWNGGFSRDKWLCGDEMTLIRWTERKK